MGEEGGRQPLPVRAAPTHPPTARAPASRADQVPAPAARPPDSHWLLRPPVKQAWGAGAQAAASGPAEFRVPTRDPSAPSSLRLASAPRRQRPWRFGSASRTPRLAEARCGRMWRLEGGRLGGTRFLPFPGRWAPSAGRFIYAAKVPQRLCPPRELSACKG